LTENFTGLHNTAAEITYFQKCQKMDSAGSITALYNSKGADSQRQNFNYTDSIHTHNMKTVLNCTHLQNCIWNCARMNKVSCLHVHCAVMNCVTAPIYMYTVRFRNLLQCSQKLASPLPG